MKYDIIRFYKAGTKKLIKSQCSEKEKDEWCNSPKTSKAGKWFDGFTSGNHYACQQKNPLYPNNFSPEDLPKYN